MIIGPNVRCVRVEPPSAQCTSTTAVTHFTILLSSGVHVQGGLRHYSCTLTRTYSIFLLSPPPDGPWSGTKSNFPVSHPTPGIQIVDHIRHLTKKWDKKYLENKPERRERRTILEFAGGGGGL